MSSGDHQELFDHVIFVCDVIMACLRAPKSGSARDQQNKVEAAYNIEEASKCLAWIGDMTGEAISVPDDKNKNKQSDFFHKTLKDGLLLCKLVNCVIPEDSRIDMSAKTFQIANLEPMEASRQRSRIELFVYKCLEFGVSDNSTFSTDQLYERTNLPQVCATIRQLGMEAESRPSYTGARVWPKKSEMNIRNFTDEQLRMGESVINLQMGTNKFANQSGMTFGKNRNVTNDKNAKTH